MATNKYLSLVAIFTLVLAGCKTAQIRNSTTTAFGGGFQNSEIAEVPRTQKSTVQCEKKIEQIQPITAATIKIKNPPLSGLGTLVTAHKIANRLKNTSYTPQTDSTLSNPHEIKEEPLAKASLILSIVGFPALFLSGLGIFCFILGIIFGIVALSKIKKHPSELSGKNNAIAGIVISSIALLLIILAVTLFLIAIAGTY